jgi:hypothetical protein
VDEDRITKKIAALAPPKEDKPRSPIWGAASVAAIRRHEHE